MRRWAALALSAGLVAGCSSEPETLEIGEIEVSGDVGGIPVVTFEAPLTLDEADSRILMAGTGTPLVEGAPLLLRATSYDGSDGTVETEGDFLLVSYTVEDLGEDLHAALAGQAEGARVLVVQPVEGEAGKEMLISIADVLPTRATGEPVPPPEGVPAVTVGENGAPSVPLDGADVTSLRIVPTIEGTGPQVAPGQQVILQYTAWLPDGTVWDSTWDAGAVPALVAIDDVFPGMRDGILDQRVGSQVLLYVPPAEALGSDPLVIVADILAAYEPPER